MKRSEWLRFLAVVTLLAGTAVFLSAHRTGEIIPRAENPEAFPLELGGWRGVDQPIGADVLEVLGPGQFLSRVYKNPAIPAPVDFFLAYFPSQRTGNAIHSPKNCLPGAGWTPLSSDYVPITLASGRRADVNRFILGQGQNRMLVLYWYQSHNRVIASEYWAKLYLIADSMRMNRSDAGLIRVVTPILSNESADVAQARILQFTQLVIPLAGRYIPK